MPVKLEKKLSIEDKLSETEAKKDVKILTDIAEKLPSASKVRVYKRDDDGKKMFLTAISAEDFPVSNSHEYIKSRYYEKYGGGDYVIELVDGGGDIVGKSEVGLVDDVQKEGDTRYFDMMNKAIKVKEEATDRVVDAERSIREAEKVKYESALETINRIWESTAKMYESKVSELERQKDKAPESMQIMWQMQIDGLKREIESERRRIEEQVRGKEEGKVATDKMFDLVNTLIPLIIEKSTVQGKDPIAVLTDTVSLVESMTGRKKDFIESILDNPEKMRIFQKVVGIDEDSKGKKDSLSELLDSTQKFDALRKAMGVDKQDELMAEIRKMGEKAVVPVEPPKDFLDELIGARNKYEVLRSMFSPSQPAKTLIELLSSLAMNLGPPIIKGIEQITNSMVTIELVRKGLVTQMQDGTIVPLQGKKTEVRADKADVKEAVAETVKEEESVDIRRMFENIVIDVSSAGEMDTKVFVDKVSDAVINRVKENPRLMAEGMRLGNLVDNMSLVMERSLGLDNVASRAISNAIVENIKSKIFQPVL